MAATGDSPARSRVAFTYPDFSLYELARFFMLGGLEMQSVAVGWQVYEITRRPLDLGLAGLAQFLPGILLFLVSGHAVDRFDRRRILIVCYSGFALCSSLLLFEVLYGLRTVYPIYAVLILIGIVRSFNGPVSRALLPQIVPEQHFPNAVAWNSIVFQSATVLGPSIGGVVYALTKGPSAVYTLTILSGLLGIFCTFQIKSQTKPRARQEFSMKTVLAGLDYIFRQKVVLGSVSLDLFAVLLGGAVALLPVYAREILKTGPWGLGLLRSAPSIGAGAMAFLIAHRPLRNRMGATMLWCVAGFGAFTILFGISHNLILSMVALILVGATDMVSVVVRAMLVQLATPDEMRGRVNAVDMIFIGASNELGQFESGLTAQWLGTVPAVVLGGIGTLIVTGLWARSFPEIRRIDRITSQE
jgi:MFS family permease